MKGGPMPSNPKIGTACARLATDVLQAKGPQDSPSIAATAPWSVHH